MHLPTLTGERVNLRRLKRSDAECIVRHANDRRVSKWLPLMPYPYSLEDARKFTNQSHRQARSDTAYNFGIKLIESGEIIGGISLSNINTDDWNAEVGYWVARKYWRRGIATEALSLILGFAFGEMRLRRVYAVVHSANKGSVRLMERAGFKREGVWREGSRLNKRWEDVYAYGMLRREFKP